MQLKTLIESCGGHAPFKEIVNCIHEDKFLDTAPVFVYYNGLDHYDALLLNGTKSAHDILTASEIAVGDYVAVNESTLDDEHDYVAVNEDLASDVDDSVQDNERDGWMMM